MYLLQVYSVRVRVNTDHVLGLLLEKEQFNIARKYAELVNSTKSQISIKEVQDYLCIASIDSVQQKCTHTYTHSPSKESTVIYYVRV